MLIRQAARPRVRPQGNLVYRLNRSHRLAAELRALVLFGPPFGLGRDLVTGAMLRPQAGAAEPGLTSDGMGLLAGTGGANNTVATAEAIASWAIHGDLTVGWRGYVGDTGSGGGLLACGDDVASNSPWRLFLGGNFASHTLFRAGPSGYRRWSGASPGVTRFVDYDAMLTKSVSHGDDISVAPTFYTSGIAAGSANSQDGSGSGPASGGPFVLTTAYPAFVNPWHTSNIAFAAARRWTADEHLLFHLEPYAAIEEAPRWYFGGSAAPTVHEFTADDVTTGAPTLGTPALGQVHALGATGVATGAPSLGTPALAQSHALAASGVATGAPTLGTPALGQIHALGAVGTATGAPTLGAPALGQVHALGAAGVATGAPTLGSPALGQVHALAPAGVSAGAPVLGTPSLAQVHVFGAVGLTTGAPTLGTPALNPTQAAVPLSRTYRIPAAPRRHALAAEPRTYRLRAAPRRYTAPPEA